MLLLEFRKESVGLWKPGLHTSEVYACQPWHSRLIYFASADNVWNFRRRTHRNRLFDRCGCLRAFGPESGIARENDIRRPGSGRLGRDSQVARPIMTGCPTVSCLKCLRSSGICHGISPPKPISPPRPAATTALSSRRRPVEELPRLKGCAPDISRMSGMSFSKGKTMLISIK